MMLAQYMTNLAHTRTLKGVNRFSQERILVVPDQTRRLDDDLETNCVNRKGADATPSNSKEKDRGFYP